MFQDILAMGTGGGSGGSCTALYENLTVQQTYTIEMLSGCIALGCQSGNPTAWLIVDNGTVLRNEKVYSDEVINYDTTTHIATYKTKYSSQGKSLVIAYTE